MPKMEWMGEKIGAVSLELLRHSPFAVLLVGVRGFELPTSTSRTWRANQLCYTPSPKIECKGTHFSEYCNVFADIFLLQGKIFI